MATITIELPEAAIDHARECAATVNQPSLEVWILEWLTNTVKSIEKQRKQRDIDKLATKIDAQVDALYSDGSVATVPVITIRKVI